MIKAKVIKPHTPFKPGVFRQAIHAEGITVMADMLKDFNKTTRTWKHQVDFKGVVKDTGKQVSVTVSTKDEIYGYVDQGTRAHIIRPKRAKALAFLSKYKAKTTPHSISSKQGGASGKQVFAQEVHHPGTDPRYFSRDIQAMWQPKLAKRIQAAITKAAKASNRGVK